MKKMTRVVLVSAVALMAVVPAVGGHNPNCETDPYLAVAFSNGPGACTHPKNANQHCMLWVQSDALLKDGVCQNL